MKPLNPYQGAAPKAMEQMGAGIAQVGANIADITQRGYESMGKGLAGGINAVGNAYQQYKDDEAKFAATKKMYKAFGGSLDEGARKEVDAIFADTSMSVREKNALAPTLMQFLGASNQQQQALAKQKAELDAAMAGRQYSEGAATGRTNAQIAAGKEELAMKLLYGQPTTGGTSFGNAPGQPQKQFQQQQFTLPDYSNYGQPLPRR